MKYPLCTVLIQKPITAISRKHDALRHSIERFEVFAALLVAAHDSVRNVLIGPGIPTVMRALCRIRAATTLARDS